MRSRAFFERGGIMNMREYINLLTDQLETLKEAQQDALNKEFYGDVAELSKQIKITGLWLLQAYGKRGE